jgi:galactonate dehydratase
MTITSIDTVRLGEFPNLLYVLVQVDGGSAGTGETFYGATAAEAWIHDVAAPLLLGRDPREIEGISRDLQASFGAGGPGPGAETRARSAIDIALWDLLGQATGQPLYALLGGLTTEHMRVYNTCAGARYVRQRAEQLSSNWGLPDEPARDPYEDLDAFLHRADELATSLLEQGISAMKIWPFDHLAETTGGLAISTADIDRALEPLRRIRSAVGNEMDVMLELHGLWDRASARRIIAAADEFAPYWYEDPIRADDIEGLALLARETRTPLAVGETVSGLSTFRRLCEAAAVGIVVVDVGWTGGLTAARKIAAIAESYRLPVTPHDCTGPIGFTVGTHLACAIPNGLIQETVRAHLASWYDELVEGLPRVASGTITPPDAPGLGVRLRDDVLGRPDTTVRRSSFAIAG